MINKNVLTDLIATILHVSDTYRRLLADRPSLRRNPLD